MKATIEKRFDDLAVGDIIVREGTRLACWHIGKKTDGKKTDGKFVQCVTLGGPLIFTIDLPRGADGLVQVEIEQQPAPLTPAQQHADELLELVQLVCGAGDAARGFNDSARPLLDKINPPKPVTLDEALRAIADVREVMNLPGLGIDRGQYLDALLDRARRCGMLS